MTGSTEGDMQGADTMTAVKDVSLACQSGRCRCLDLHHDTSISFSHTTLYISPNLAYAVSYSCTQSIGKAGPQCSTARHILQ